MAENMAGRFTTGIVSDAKADDHSDNVVEDGAR